MLVSGRSKSTFICNILTKTNERWFMFSVDIRRTNGFSKMNEKEIKEGKVWEILIPQNHKIAGIENEYDECGKLTGSTATRRVEYELDLTFNRIRSPVLTAPPPGGSQKTCSSIRIIPVKFSSFLRFTTNVWLFINDNEVIGPFTIKLI